MLPLWPEPSPGPKPVSDRLCLQGILFVGVPRRARCQSTAARPAATAMAAGKVGHPRQRPDAVLGDKGYDSNQNRKELRHTWPPTATAHTPLRFPGQYHDPGFLPPTSTTPTPGPTLSAWRRIPQHRPLRSRNYRRSYLRNHSSPSRLSKHGRTS